MPLLAQGWEVGDLIYYQTYTRWIGITALETRYVHRDPLTGFGGSYALLVDSAGLRTPKISGTPRWAHCWMYTQDIALTNGFPFQFREISDNRSHISVRVNDDGAVQIRLGTATGSVLATSGGNLDMTVGHWWAIEVVVANAGGVVNVYIDDSLFVTYTGDTQNGGNALWDMFVMSDITGSSGIVDDIIITDVGEGKLPEQFGRGSEITSDDSVALTPSAGSDNWINVSTLNTDTYNAGTSGPLVDLYGVRGNLVLGIVNCVTVQGLAAFQNGFTMRTQLKSGATTVSSADQSGIATYRSLPTTIQATDPDTAVAWTADGVNALQIGVQSGT